MLDVRIMRTNKEVIVDMGKQHPAIGASYTVVIPQGTSVEPCGDGSGQYWVSNWSFLESALQRHDAYYYGIRVDACDVDDKRPDADVG
jgi:hypothetical protein